MIPKKNRRERRSYSMKKNWDTEEFNALRRERQDVLEQYKRHDITAVEAVRRKDEIDRRLVQVRRGRK
jgi:hypothetical protein